jgi:CRP-like cAMP-binding protein/glyoxylase-like metal-dependent hydrolase (beta-lactamase superfamily II)
MNATTTPAPAATLDILCTMPGAHVIRSGTELVAVGFPEEVVKSWMKAGVMPNAWLVPDTRSAHGIVQWALEFPLYHALFVRGTFGRGQKVPVVCTQAQWADVCEYLRLTLLGLTREELRAAGTASDVADMLSREGTYLALKHADGRVAQMEDFLQPVFFNDEGVATLGGLTIRRHGGDTWSFYAQQDRVEEFHLDIPAGQQPVYAQALPNAAAPVVPQPLEVIMLGASNGFDVHNPCSNMVVQANGRFLLVDAGPYIRTTLRAAGVGMNQLGALIITHAHEDHAVGLNALLEARQRIRLFISAENADILSRKLAILNPNVSSPATLLRDAFDVTLVAPAQLYAFGGMSLKFHHTFHSIPCTGVEVSVSGPEGRRRVLVVGDHDAAAHIRTAHEKGAIPAARMAQLQALYAWEGDLVVADAGDGAIHGATADFADSPARQVVYVHTGKLKDEDRGRFTLARAGYRYTVSQEQPRAGALERALAQRAVSAAFPDAAADTVNELLDGAQVMSVNPGHVVVRQDAADQDLYVVLCGEMVTLRREGGAVRELARVDAGEVFGERAAVRGAPRAASVVALTPARVLRVPAEVFVRFSQAMDLQRKLPAMWEKRAAMDGVRMLEGASITIKDMLAGAARRCTVSPGTTLIRENSRSSTVYVLTAGRVQVYKGDAPLLVSGTPVIVEPGTMIGETAPFLGQPRNASIVALDECEVLAIRGPDFRRIVERSPQLFCHISRTVKQRAAA